jgi:hypothetical protein
MRINLDSDKLKNVGYRAGAHREEMMVQYGAPLLCPDFFKTPYFKLSWAVPPNLITIYLHSIVSLFGFLPLFIILPNF